MKITYFINEITGAGGIRKVTIIKANALAERGHHVEIIVSNYDSNGFFAEPISDKVKIVQLPSNHTSSIFPHLRAVNTLLKTRKWLSRYIQEEKPDFLINVGHSGRLLMITLHHYDTKFIYELHFNSRYQLIDNPQGWKYAYNLLKNWFLYRMAGHCWERIVLLTEHDLRYDWIGTKDNSTVIPNPVTIHPQSSALTEKTIISVGRLHSQKNFEQLIRAFALVNKKHSDWQLKIFGEGPERIALQHLIDSLNITQFVHLLGLTNEIPKELSQSSIFALASKHEGFGLVITEAMSCGLPVVANRVPGITDIVDGQQCGFLVQLNDHKEMAEKICKLIELPDLRARMSQNALRRANDFTISKVLDQWEALFYEMKSI